MEWNKIIQVLREGGVVTHPTDTCYGLACDPLNKEAMTRFFELKGMPANKPVTIMVSDMGKAQQYGVFSKKAFEIGSEGWPGDLTLVLSRHGSDGTVGIRVPGDDFTLEMLNRWGGPLTTTSANLSGEKSPYSINDCVRGAYVVDVGPIPKREPSTVVQVIGDEVTVLRQGAFRVESL